jgi:bifunctional DNase/RNase
VKHVDLAGLGLEASSGTPIVLLREHDEPHRVLPIFVGGSEAVAIAAAATGEPPPRPLTHDLTAALVRELGGHIDAVQVTAVADGTYYAEITLGGPDGVRRVDARPSDAIALALRFGATLLVSDAVLDEAATVVLEESDAEAADASAAAEPMEPAAIDQAVEEFRSFLDHVDPSAFDAGRDGPDDAPGTAGGDGTADEPDDDTG